MDVVGRPTLALAAEVRLVEEGGDARLEVRVVGQQRALALGSVRGVNAPGVGPLTRLRVQNAANAATAAVVLVAVITENRSDVSLDELLLVEVPLGGLHGLRTLDLLCRISAEPLVVNAVWVIAPRNAVQVVPNQRRLESKRHLEGHHIHDAEDVLHGPLPRLDLGDLELPGQLPLFLESGDGYVQAFYVFGQEREDLRFVGVPGAPEKADAFGGEPLPAEGLRELVDREGLLARELGQAPGIEPPGQLHLKKTVLSVRDPLQEEEVRAALGVDVRHAVLVPENFRGVLQGGLASGDLRWDAGRRRRGRDHVVVQQRLLRERGHHHLADDGERDALQKRSKYGLGLLRHGFRRRLRAADRLSLRLRTLLAPGPLHHSPLSQPLSAAKGTHHDNAPMDAIQQVVRARTHA
mmetsp:Transcript_848/g.1839  ORF Transcript_848/g.1839 Transcript_848/m.1839 type:complete len:409 (+) Transcript_848:1861-3087(+)